MARPVRILGVTVARNEEDRYLASMLRWALLNAVDDLFLFDDLSEDGTRTCAEALGAMIQVRGADQASFLEHEGKFRQAAWNAFERAMGPRPGDWILAIDADEFLVSKTNSCPRCDLAEAARLADAVGAKSVLVPIPEVFGWDGDGTPLVRVDGLWGTIRGTRFFRYELGGVFQDKSMGCGSEPTYVGMSKHSPTAFGLHLMHFGYADAADQVDKHKRYTSLAAHGHNDQHVQSIVGAKQLVRWDGPIPKVERGDAQGGPRPAIRTPTELDLNQLPLPVGLVEGEIRNQGSNLESTDPKSVVLPITPFRNG